MTAEPPTLHVLTGPTAVGKTEWALRWAERHRAEILSCDSLLFYRGMDIGTAKPSRAELARVPHHLIDVCAVDEAMDVARFTTLAQQAVAAIQARGRAVLITGGSGFYLKPFFGPVVDAVAVTAEHRAAVQTLADREGLPGLLAALRRLNPDGLGTLDIANPRRVQRALERCLASGESLATLAEKFAQLPGPFAGQRVLCTCLDRAPDILRERVTQRVEAMLNAGLIDEVSGLRQRGLETNSSAAKAIGYRETLAYLNGALSRTELPEAITRNTLALVKKQRTWFRTQLPANTRHGDAGQVQLDTLFAPP